MLKSNFEGKTRIFKKEENNIVKYSTQLSKKNINGEWENIYVDLQFPKNTFLENKEDIYINKSFLSWYKTENGYIHFKLVIMEYKKISKEEYAAGGVVETNELFDNTQLPF